MNVKRNRSNSFSFSGNRQMKKKKLPDGFGNYYDSKNSLGYENDNNLNEYQRSKRILSILRLLKSSDDERVFTENIIKNESSLKEEELKRDSTNYNDISSNLKKIKELKESKNALKVQENELEKNDYQKNDYQKETGGILKKKFFQVPKSGYVK